MPNIIEQKYKWKSSLTKRKATNYIVLHHRAGLGDVNSIHNGHLANGWSGIGYHFYVRQDGSVYRGRPIDTVGAHCPGRNSDSIGVCFEGNYEQTKTMPAPQFKAGQELISYINTIYKNSLKIKRHSDYLATACPGKYFPFDSITKPYKAKLEAIEDIAEELNSKKIISDIKLWKDFMEKDKNVYWLCYKSANFVRNLPLEPHDGPRLETANDIAWLLGFKEIMTDLKYWMDRMTVEHDTIYWLCYKLAYYINTH